MSKYAHLGVQELILLIENEPDNVAALREYFERTAPHLQRPAQVGNRRLWVAEKS